MSDENIIARMLGAVAPPQGSDEGTGDGTPTDETLQAALDNDAEDEGERGDMPEHDESDPSEDGNSDPDAPKSRRYTVKVDGTEIEVDETELVKGYQRQTDYTRKTQEVAEQRKAAEAERQAAAQERALYQQRLAAVAQTLQEQPIDWETLHREDPLEYVHQRALQQERQQNAAAVAREQHRVAQQEAQEQRAKILQLVAEEKGRLLEALPDLKDPAKEKETLFKVKVYAQSQGFSPAELVQTYDHRAVLMLHKAMRYDELVAKAKTARPTVSQVAPAARTAAPRKDQANDARQRLKKSGRVEDAAAAMMRT